MYKVLCINKKVDWVSAFMFTSDLSPIASIFISARKFYMSMYAIVEMHLNASKY